MGSGSTRQSESTRLAGTTRPCNRPMSVYPHRASLKNIPDHCSGGGHNPPWSGIKRGGYTHYEIIDETLLLL